MLQNWTADTLLPLLVNHWLRIRGQVIPGSAIPAHHQSKTNPSGCHLISYSVVFGEGLASWWWQRCHSRFPQRWNSVEIGSPALGVLTLGIRIHNRMGRTNYPDTSLRGICKWLQGNGKQNWHPLNNPLTFLFSLRDAVSVALWHVCANIYTVLVPWGLVHAHIYFCVGGCCFYCSQMRTSRMNVGYENSCA